MTSFAVPLYRFADGVVYVQKSDKSCFVVNDRGSVKISVARVSC